MVILSAMVGNQERKKYSQPVSSLFSLSLLDSSTILVYACLTLDQRFYFVNKKKSGLSSSAQLVCDCNLMLREHTNGNATSSCERNWGFFVPSARQRSPNFLCYTSK